MERARGGEVVVTARTTLVAPSFARLRAAGGPGRSPCETRRKLEDTKRQWKVDKGQWNAAAQGKLAAAVRCMCIRTYLPQPAIQRHSPSLWPLLVGNTVFST